MSLRVNLPKTFRDLLAESKKPLIGLWASSGSAIMAEIVASSGADWVLLDTEHSPNGLESTVAQLHAMAAYDATPLVRLPYGDTVLIKQFLDLGAQNLLIPMVNSAAQAEEIVRAMQYPPHGVRGIGSALARSARWNRVDDYLQKAPEFISLTVQIETAEAVKNAEEIVAVSGVDAVFIGPSDLSASMGYLGQQNHPEVKKAIAETIKIANKAGKPVGVNAFVASDAKEYLDAGADFVAVGADVALVARASESLVATFNDLAGEKQGGQTERASY